MPRLTGPLQPRRNWPTWASTVVITHPILRSFPVGLPPVPWTEKQLKDRHFSSEAVVIAAAERGWTDNIVNFFWVACKS